jgi:hypothetical protein
VVTESTEIFFNLKTGLLIEAPGSRADTKRAFSMLSFSVKRAGKSDINYKKGPSTVKVAKLDGNTVFDHAEFPGLPDENRWDYFNPLEKRASTLLKKHAGSPALRDILVDVTREISSPCECLTRAGHVFDVMGDSREVSAA